MFNTLNPRSRSLGSSPGQGHCVVSLGKTLTCRCIKLMGTSELFQRKPKKLHPIHVLLLATSYIRNWDKLQQSAPRLHFFTQAQTTVCYEMTDTILNEVLFFTVSKYNMWKYLHVEVLQHCWKPTKILYMFWSSWEILAFPEKPLTFECRPST